MMQNCLSSPCCHIIIQFALIGKAPSSSGHLPRQSYSPKIVRASGPWRVVVEKKKNKKKTHFWPFFFFFLVKIHPITSRAQKQNDNASVQICTMSSTTGLTLVLQNSGSLFLSCSMDLNGSISLFLKVTNVIIGSLFFSPLHLVNYVLTQPGTQAFRAWIMHTTWLLHVSAQISECTKEEYSSRMSSERVLSSLHANKQKPQVPGEGRVIDLWERLRLVRIGWESSSSIQEQW